MVNCKICSLQINFYIQECEEHLSVGSEAESHYKAVCRAGVDVFHGEDQVTRRHGDVGRVEGAGGARLGKMD